MMDIEDVRKDLCVMKTNKEIVDYSVVIGSDGIVDINIFIIHQPIAKEIKIDKTFLGDDVTN